MTSTTGGSFERIEVPAGDLCFDALAAGPASGELVLLLHGFPESSWEWRAQIGALADAGYRVVAPDQRGYSPRARPEGVDSYRAGSLAADALAVADWTGGHTFHLVGHDWGAAVAWQVAARYPGRVRTLTAVSVPHPLAMAEAMGSSDDQRVRSSYISVFRQPEVAERYLLSDGGVGLRSLLALSGFRDHDAIDRYVELLVQPGALTAALNWYRAIDWSDLAGLGPVEVPTMFVWSTGDVAIGRHAAEACAAHVRGPYRFEVLDGVSHWIPEDAPAELNRLLLDHLAQPGR